ncbi:MAG TPA: FAD-dependent oxidoreductase [Patescibacteria group bacterium]|nr:FAD-dependent oxidoreductase [Patescibacteria group bacterium]
METKKQIYDAIVIGGGPGGLTAAIYLCRKMLQTLVITDTIGGQAVMSSDIENYLGFTMVTGTELAQHFRHHIAHFPQYLRVHEGLRVTALRRMAHKRSLFEVVAGEETFQSRCVIIASGRKPRRLGIPGEKEFWGRGVVHSTSADAPLYRDKTVVVIGGGNSAMDCALVLNRFAKQVYVVNNLSELHGDEMMKDKVLSQNRIRIYNNTQAREIYGQTAVGGIRVVRKEGPEEDLTVEGVFVEVGWESEVDFDQLTEKDQNKRIKVDAYMRTTVPGIFAVGDVNNIEGEHIIIAAGEGAKGALAAAEYLNTL